MEFQELADVRRSVRAYKDEALSVEELKKILSLGQKAPSWKNLQPARYYAAISAEAKKAVCECLPDFNQRSSKNASYIVTTFKKGLSGSLGEGEAAKEGDLWGAYDLGLNNAYLILAASEYGYDTLIMGIRDEEKLRDYFAIGDDETIMAVIAIGKRDQDPALRPRKDLEEIAIIR